MFKIFLYSQLEIFLVPLDTFKPHEGNYTFGRVRKVYKKKIEMYKYLKDSLKIQL